MKLYGRDRASIQYNTGQWRKPEEVMLKWDLSSDNENAPDSRLIQNNLLAGYFIKTQKEATCAKAVNIH